MLIKLSMENKLQARAYFCSSLNKSGNVNFLFPNVLGMSLNFIFCVLFVASGAVSF